MCRRCGKGATDERWKGKFSCTDTLDSSSLGPHRSMALKSAQLTVSQSHFLFQPAFARCLTAVVDLIRWRRSIV